MSSWCIEELLRDLSAARNAKVVDATTYREARDRLDLAERRVDQATQTAIGICRDHDMSVEETKQAIGIASKYTQRGEYPERAARHAALIVATFRRIVG